MSGSENNKEITPKPLPKELLALVDKEEEDKRTRSDYENSWTTT